jgi:CheY-like chemotaxis protein
MAIFHERIGRLSPAAGARRRILVVDDSADMRDVLQEVLGRAGYEVVGASSGQRALTLMRDGIPDLVITDLLMPEMSGFALRAAMLRRPELARVPVVILSGYWRRPGETLEAAEVLPKPLSINRLLATVGRLIDPAPGTEDGVAL